MAQYHRKRHIFFGFVGGKPEHKSLVARSYLIEVASSRLFFEAVIYAQSYIGGLTVKEYLYFRAVGRKTVFLFIIPYFSYSVSRHFFYVYFRYRGDFSHDEQKVFGTATFASHSRVLVFR